MAGEASCSTTDLNMSGHQYPCSAAPEHIAEDTKNVSCSQSCPNMKGTSLVTRCFGNKLKCLAVHVLVNEGYGSR